MSPDLTLTVNRIEISSKSRAARYRDYPYLPVDHPVLQALIRIQTDPHPDGETIEEILSDPAEVYRYNDGKCQIGFTKLWFPSEGVYVISVFTIEEIEQ